MTQFRENPRKPHFWTIFGPNWPKKIFFSKIGLRHFLGFMKTHHHAKNQKKLMIQSREKRVTDGRTHGRTGVNL